MLKIILTFCYFLCCQLVLTGCNSNESASASALPNQSGNAAESNFQSGPPLEDDVRFDERLSNGNNFDNISSIWICSTANYTRGYGLVFLRDEGKPSGGFLYYPDGVISAFLWYTYESEEDGFFRLLVGNVPYSNSKINLPEFTSPDVFTSTNVNFIRQDYGPTTCIREPYSRPVMI